MFITILRPHNFFMVKNMKLAFLSLFFLHTLVSLVGQANADNGLKTAIFLRPDKAEGEFWDIFTDAMKAASKDLDIQLKIIPSYSDPFQLVQNARIVSRMSPKPDLVIFRVQDSVGQQLLNVFEDAKIDMLVVNTGFSKKNQIKVGKPRERYEHWIGQIIPDDFNAGKQIAEYLYKKALAKGMTQNGQVTSIAINGVKGTRASEERMSGLYESLEIYRNFTLNKSSEGYYEAEPAKITTRMLLKHYPETNIIWAVNDNSAIGAVKAVKERNLIPGQDILICGIDWVPEVFKYIRNGEIEASLGGHVMEGAWALILAYDYKNGHDFIETTGAEIYSSMKIIDRSNIDLFSARIESVNWNEINFKAFTKTHNTNFKNYNFDVLDALQRVR